MATPLGNHPEWDPASVDGPGQTSATARSLELATILRFASSAARAAAFTAAGVDPEGSVTRLDTDPAALYVHDGTTYQRHSPAAKVTVSGSGVLEFSGSRNASVVVTFPVGTFASTPAVVANVNSAAGAAAGVVVRTLAVSSSGATLGGDKGDATLITASLPVVWVATGTPA